MTYTAEQLREWAANSEASIRALGLKETDFKIANYLADVLRAHADALEENARLKAELARKDAVILGQARDKQEAERLLESAEAECERLREDAERYRWLITEGGIEWNPAHDAAIDAVRRK